MSMKIKYEKSLANIYPDIALEWHPTRNGELTPYGVSAKSGKKVWWHCSEGVVRQIKRCFVRQIISC